MRTWHAEGAREGLSPVWSYCSDTLTWKKEYRLCILMVSFIFPFPLTSVWTDLGRGTIKSDGTLTSAVPVLKYGRIRLQRELAGMPRTENRIETLGVFGAHPTYYFPHNKIKWGLGLPICQFCKENVNFSYKSNWQNCTKCLCCISIDSIYLIVMANVYIYIY